METSDVALPQEWWDCIPEAGPKQRPQTSSNTDRPTLELLAVQNNELQCLDCKNLVVRKCLQKTIQIVATSDCGASGFPWPFKPELLNPPPRLQTD